MTIYMSEQAVKPRRRVSSAFCSFVTKAHITVRGGSRGRAKEGEGKEEKKGRALAGERESKGARNS